MEELVALAMSEALGNGPAHAASQELVPVRIATTCTQDTSEAISAAVHELITAFHDVNDCGAASVAVAIFTATPDLRAAKPAAAARAAGWAATQFLCVAEMPTVDDVPFCLRALLLVRRGIGANRLRAVYLNGALALRPDLVATA
jgi:chorismate mutase